MQPSITEDFAARHDRAIMGCLSELLGNDGPLHLDDQALQRAKLPLRLGGLGLRSAEAGRCAAYWASWADTLPTLQDRVPELVAAAYPLAGNAGAVPATSGVAELLQAATRLNEAGYMTPGWAGMRSSLAGNRRGSLPSAIMVIPCEAGSELRLPVWTNLRARAFTLTLTRLHAP